jgi:dTDP-3-amino-3,4,6-trideoxy-alpha-D-glucose transaminase
MSSRIPFTDLGAGFRREESGIAAAIARVAASGWYVGGPEVAAFETAFARFAGVPFAVGVANGTDAIALALRALGIGRGDVVLLPALSAYPTTVGVLQAEATPSFVDVDQHGLIDVSGVEQLLARSSVRAILCVHLYGNCADLATLRRVTRQHGVALVEDCAQAHGASRDGMPAGTAGDLAAWSFYPTKNLGAMGDAGAVTCSDEALAQRLARLRNYGQQNRYEHVERGYNSRLDPLQAAILSVKLANLESENARRRTIGQRYAEALAACEEIVSVPLPPGSIPNRHLYPVLLPSPELRSSYQAFLAERGIETLIHYPIAMPDQKASDAEWSGGRDFPQARKFCSRVVSLPCHPDLSDQQVEDVISISLQWSQRGRRDP